MAEHVEAGDLEAEPLAQGRHHGRQTQRIAADVEEVVLGTDPLHAERLAPDPGDAPLQVGTDVGRAAGDAADVGLGQGLAVDLAVRGERQPGQGDEGGGNHVGGQALAEGGAQSGGVQRTGRADQVAGQAAFAGPVLADDGDGGGDAGQPAQGGLHLAEFDPVAVELDLAVDPLQVLQAAVGQVAYQIAGAVGAAGAAVRGGDEAFGGQLGPAEVAVGDTVAGQVQLAGDAGRDQDAALVEDVAAGVADGPADGGRLAGRHPVHGGPDGGLGRSVHVVQRSDTGRELPGQLVRQRFAAAQRPQRRIAGPAGGDQHLPGGRGGLEDGGCGAFHALAQGDSVGGLGGREDLHGAAPHQRQVQLQARDVEAHGGQREQRVPGVEAGPAGHGPQEVDQRPVTDLDALGQAGGAGGVDHIGGSVRVGAVEGGRRRPCGERGGDRYRGHRELRQGAAQRLVGHHQSGAGVLEHVADPGGRVDRVDRHVGGAGAQDGEQADQQFGRALQVDADERAGARAEAGEVPGQPVGGLVEFAVAEGTVLEADGGGVRCGAGDVGDQPGHGLLARILLAGVVPPAEQQFPFLGCEQAGGAERAAGVGGEVVEEGGEVSGEPALVVRGQSGARVEADGSVGVDADGQRPAARFGRATRQNDGDGQPGAGGAGQVRVAQGQVAPVRRAVPESVERGAEQCGEAGKGLVEQSFRCVQGHVRREDAAGGLGGRSRDGHGDVPLVAPGEPGEEGQDGGEGRPLGLRPPLPQGVGQRDRARRAGHRLQRAEPRREHRSQ